jgi:hypothetical protein
MKCPICGCKNFYVKDPEDEYETYGFELKDGEVSLDDQDDTGELEIDSDTETYCDKCSWHGKLQELK